MEAEMRSHYADVEKAVGTVEAMPSDQGAVTHNVEQLLRYSGILHERIDELTVALGPVLRPSAEPEPTLSEQRSHVSEVAQELDRVLLTIDVACARLNALAHRVDV